MLNIKVTTHYKPQKRSYPKPHIYQKPKTIRSGFKSDDAAFLFAKNQATWHGTESVTVEITKPE